MSDLVQQILAFGLVALAAAWLVRRAWRRRKQTSVCADCPGCEGPAAPPVSVRPLVQIRELDQGR